MNKNYFALDAIAYNLNIEMDKIINEIDETESHIESIKSAMSECADEMLDVYELEYEHESYRWSDLQEQYRLINDAIDHISKAMESIKYL